MFRIRFHIFIKCGWRIQYQFRALHLKLIKEVDWRKFLTKLEEQRSNIIEAESRAGLGTITTNFGPGDNTKT